MSMRQADDRLGTAPIGRLIRELALPGIVAQVINLLYNIVDRIYIGRIPEIGSLALGGIGISMPIILIISAFAAFATSGGAPLASISLGAGGRDKAEQYLNSNAGFILAVSLAVTVLGSVFLSPLLRFFGAQANNFSYAHDYMQIYILGTVFVLGTLALNSFISAQGEAMTAMRTVLIGAVSNIILDPIFIFLLGMGVRGAAVATVISQALSFLSSLLFLRSDRSRLKLTGIRIEPALLLQCLALGISGFTMQATESAVTTVFNRLLGVYGGELHVSAMVIMQSMIQITFIPLLGYQTGVQPLLSYNYGARNQQRVTAVLKISFILQFGFALAASLTAILFPHLVARVFTDDPVLIDVVARYLPIFMAGMSIFGLQMTAQMYFVGSNKPKHAILLAALRKLVLLIPLCFILSAKLGLKGIYMAEPIADAGSALTAGALLLFQLRSMKEGRERPDGA